ncbi:MAG: recombination protein RecR [Parcubacteria group bacterium 21-54-25]|nr:MAG: recombination protein RecR [Parcubacteria group bacterium 21-54-25]HQU07782.1 toprim domain-containing protein [Candidatus Paceibacterota bacterium]
MPESDSINRLVYAFERFPGIGPRQARRFVYHLLAAPPADRALLSELISTLAKNVRQCPECLRFWSGAGERCNYCADRSRDDSLLMLVEKDQDITAIERANAYRGRYFVLGGVLTLSGKGAVREQELAHVLKARLARGLKEVILALSATSEGEHTADHLRELLAPYRSQLRITMLGRGLSTGSELEYVDAQTISGAFLNRKDS